MKYFNLHNLFTLVYIISGVVPRSKNNNHILIVYTLFSIYCYALFSYRILLRRRIKHTRTFSFSHVQQFRHLQLDWPRFKTFSLILLHFLLTSLESTYCSVSVLLRYSVASAIWAWKNSSGIDIPGRKSALPKLFVRCTWSKNAAETTRDIWLLCNNCVIVKRTAQ